MKTPVDWLNRPPDVEAEVTLLTPEEGGRSDPVENGYRPAHLVRPDFLTSGVHHFQARRSVRPGETAKASITFLSPEEYPRSLWIGKVVTVQEGGKVVGWAKITRILNRSLETEAPEQDAG